MTEFVEIYDTTDDKNNISIAEPIQPQIVAHNVRSFDVTICNCICCYNSILPIDIEDPIYENDITYQIQPKICFHFIFKFMCIDGVKYMLFFILLCLLILFCASTKK